MIAPACPRCDTIHSPASVAAVGRFNPDGPTGYQSPDGPIRATRAEAEADLCARRQERRAS